MSPLVEFLEAICKEAEENCELSYSISLEELKADGGLYFELGEGFTETRYYDNSTVKVVPVLILGRYKEQQKAINELWAISNYFEKLEELQGKNYSLLKSEITKEVNKIARDADGMYHFSCILKCYLYY